MALTLRSNGTGGGIVSSGWWNDYYNLLTGVMHDQPVTLSTNFGIAPLTMTTVGSVSSDISVASFATHTNNIAYYNLVIGNGPYVGLIDGQNANSLIWWGSHVSFTITPPLLLPGGLGTATTGVALTFKDQSGNIEFDANAPAATARGIVFAGVDTSGTLHAGLQVNSDGSMELGALDTSTSVVQLIRVYTGTTTPSGTIPDGSLWFKG
jgi:hypothetical protein